MVQIAPSILSADFSRLGEQVRDAFAAGVRRLHVDVMDGQFVPNLSVGPVVLRSLRPLADRYRATLAVHLMVVRPERFLEEFRRAGADTIIVHVEATPHIDRAIDAIRELGASPGVALNPGTPLVTLEEILPKIDEVLVMSVNPGFGGQDFIASSLDKIARLRDTLTRRGLGRVAIAVDGGVHPQTIAGVIAAGATICVAGSAVFGDSGSVAANLQELRAAAHSASHT